MLCNTDPTAKIHKRMMCQIYVVGPRGNVKLDLEKGGEEEKVSDLKSVLNPAW